MITATTLPILGVSPAIGRNFAPEEDRPGSDGVALLSDALWRRRFGAAQDITGRAMTLDNKPYTIVGVLPPRFQLLAAADVLLPMGPWAATLPDDRGWHPGIFQLARLKAGITLRQAQAEMDLISDRLAKQYPEFDQGVSADVKPLHDYAVQNVRQSLVLLAGAVGFVLLIACANVANLVLVRAVGRQKEIAIRTAIGASRARIARQLMAESLLLALAGGAAGLLLAFWAVPLLAALAGANAPAASAIVIDATALVFTIVLSIATGVLFGVAPVLQTARVDVAAAINDGGRGAAAGAAHHRLRGLLVVSEVALATMLLVGAGLLTRSLLHLQETSTGFQSEGLLVADAPLSPGAYDTTAKRNAFVERLLDQLRTTPGVEAAAIATAPPFSGGGSTIHFNITGRPPKGPEEYILTGLRAVTSDYFTTLGVPLVAGRGLTDRDRDQSLPVAIVNETFAKRYFGSQARQAVGARAQLGTVPDDESPRMEIVGIVGDTKQAFEADVQPTMRAVSAAADRRARRHTGTCPSSSRHPGTRRRWPADCGRPSTTWIAITCARANDGRRDGGIGDATAAANPAPGAVVGHRADPLADWRLWRDGLLGERAHARNRRANRAWGESGRNPGADHERGHAPGGGRHCDRRRRCAGDVARVERLAVWYQRDRSDHVRGRCRRSGVGGAGGRLRPCAPRRPHRSRCAHAMNAKRVVADLRELAARTSTDGAQRLAWGPVWRRARVVQRQGRRAAYTSGPTPPAATG
jgi:hypothetical protein